MNWRAWRIAHSHERLTARGNQLSQCLFIEEKALSAVTFYQSSG